MTGVSTRPLRLIYEARPLHASSFVFLLSGHHAQFSSIMRGPDIKKEKRSKFHSFIRWATQVPCLLLFCDSGPSWMKELTQGLGPARKRTNARAEASPCLCEDVPRVVVMTSALRPRCVNIPQRMNEQSDSDYMGRYLLFLSSFCIDGPVIVIAALIHLFFSLLSFCRHTPRFLYLSVLGVATKREGKEKRLSHHFLSFINIPAPTCWWIRKKIKDVWVLTHRSRTACGEPRAASLFF